MRGKEELIPHSDRAGRWLEEQSWGAPFHPFTSRLHRAPKGFNNNNDEFIVCIYRGGISGA